MCDDAKWCFVSLQTRKDQSQISDFTIVSHSALVNIYGYISYADDCYMVVESPNSFFVSDLVEDFTEEDVLRFITQMLSLAIYFEQKKYIHGALSVFTIYVSDSKPYTFKAAYSPYFNEIEMLKRKMYDAGVPIAPELFHIFNFSTKVDLWAIGFADFQMISGSDAQEPIFSDDPEAPCVSDELKAIIKMLTLPIESRPSAESVLNQVLQMQV